MTQVDLAGDRSSFSFINQDLAKCTIKNMSGEPLLISLHGFEFAIRSTATFPEVSDAGFIDNIETLSPFESRHGNDWAIVSREVADKLRRNANENRIIARFEELGNRPKLIDGTPCWQLRGLNLLFITLSNADPRWHVLSELDHSSIDAVAVYLPD